jgi:hypothetical protein
MTRIYRYTLASDTGMAPCIDGGWVSLATCKPRIRRGAKPGDWVIGFFPAPKGEPRGRVAWAGRISRRVEIGDYEREFRDRSDAVYRAKPNGEFKCLRPGYHTSKDAFRKDISAPALVFDPHLTWYFGNQPKMLPDSLMHLAAKGRPDLVNGTADGDLAALAAWLSQAHPPGILGTPRHPPLPATPRRKC